MQTGAAVEIPAQDDDGALGAQRGLHEGLEVRLAVDDAAKRGRRARRASNCCGVEQARSSGLRTGGLPRGLVRGERGMGRDSSSVSGLADITAVAHARTPYGRASARARS